MLNFVCLKAGKVFGAEYVNILQDMVRRNLPENYPIKFHCLTDNKKGINSDINIIKLPRDLETWWGKLYLFKEGLFPKGERVVFMDLDTIITGNLENVFKYDGEFATLSDFAQPDRLGPAIMLWESDLNGIIWTSWVARGKPRHEMGDLWWLNELWGGMYKKDADILQNLYPDEFVSYKLHCSSIPPLKAKVVCFHGLPRPHQADGWVKNFWKIGGYKSSDYEVICNTELSKVKENIDYSSRLGLPSLQLSAETSRKAIFCGGGPSLADSLYKIRQEKEAGSLIIAMNGTCEFLNKNSIIPDWLVIIDSRASNLDFVKHSYADNYFIASQCDKEIFSYLVGVKAKTTVFHIDIPYIDEYVYNDGQPIQAIGGGSTVGLMVLSLAYVMGYRDMHLYGYDSSMRGKEAHAYAQGHDDSIIEAIVNERSFYTTPWMTVQVNQWQALANQLRALGCELTVHGEGLLPYLAWVMMQQQS